MIHSGQMNNLLRDTMYASTTDSAARDRLCHGFATCRSCGNCRNRTLLRLLLDFSSSEAQRPIYRGSFCTRLLGIPPEICVSIVHASSDKLLWSRGARSDVYSGFSWSLTQDIVHFCSIEMDVQIQRQASQTHMSFAVCSMHMGEQWRRFHGTVT